MKTVFLVHPTEIEVTRKMENILLSLPEDSGILFVGIRVLQDYLETDPRKVLFRVSIGCSRTVTKELIHSVAMTYLTKEVPEAQLLVEVYQGSGRYNLGT